MEHWEVILFFFGIAMLYGSVGFGGGSSYLAILALYGFAFGDIRAIALLCNIAVVSGSLLVYMKNNLVPWRRVVPLVIMSVPLAFAGGVLQIRENVFFMILASALCVAAFLMWFQPQLKETEYTAGSHPIMNGALGGGIGFLSGIVGIGGGIFLSPVLHLIRWAQPKVIAASAALFILVNSVAGLAGQSFNPDFHFNYKLAVPLILAVIVGGQVGSRLGVTYFSQVTVKRGTALLVLYVSLRIFYKYLFA